MHSQVYMRIEFVSIRNCPYNEKLKQSWRLSAMAYPNTLIFVDLAADDPNAAGMFCAEVVRLGR